MKRKSGNLMKPVASLSIMLMKSWSSSCVGFSPISLQTVGCDVQTLQTDNATTTAPEQAAEPPGGQRAVTVRQPVEVVLEAAHRVLGQQGHHPIVDSSVLTPYCPFFSVYITTTSYTNITLNLVPITIMVSTKAKAADSPFLTIYI